MLQRDAKEKNQIRAPLGHRAIGPNSMFAWQWWALLLVVSGLKEKKSQDSSITFTGPFCGHVYNKRNSVSHGFFVGRWKGAPTNIWNIGQQSVRQLRCLTYLPHGEPKNARFRQNYWVDEALQVSALAELWQPKTPGSLAPPTEDGMWMGWWWNPQFQSPSGWCWWFGTVFVFPYIANVIIPADELIFFRGVGIPCYTMVYHQPAIQWLISYMTGWLGYNELHQLQFAGWS